MTFARYAPLSIIAAVGVAFVAACGDEKTVADAATTTFTPHTTGPLNLSRGAVTLYRWERTDR